ncbi:unnamed protein product [Euphydryas editha]|uniref:Uncharacterized protein n=1 Tax=Euphydryas editha TaxID=104508 RepID=A0AAU9TWP2_EUPED|nr:unnamed protein product [Euphydryas editha]
MAVPNQLFVVRMRRAFPPCLTCRVLAAAEHRGAVRSALTAPMRNVQPSWIITCQASELLCASENWLEWLNHSEVQGANGFTENHMEMLVPVVTLEIIHKCPWIKLE